MSTYPCPAHWPRYRPANCRCMPALYNGGNGHHASCPARKSEGRTPDPERERLAAQERFAQAELDALLREQDEEREEEGHDEPRCWGGEG